MAASFGVLRGWWMKAVPEIDRWPGTGHPEVDPEAIRAAREEPSLRDQLLSWMIRGRRDVEVDGRRRTGTHPRLRRLLLEDAPAALDSKPWQSVGWALRRQAVGQGLSQLPQEEKHVVQLAYLEGRTNTEIAAQLGVSVSTVQRRLRAALGNLETFVGRTSKALYVLVLVLLAQLALRSARLVRALGSSTGGLHRVAAVATAGIAVLAATAVVALPPVRAPAELGPSKPFLAAPPLAIVPGAPPAPLVGDRGSKRIDSPSSPPDRGTSMASSGETEHGVTSSSDAPPAASTVNRGHSNQGCDGNPTSAPPATPVGARGSPPKGAPVTHPDAGGCRD